MEPRDVLICKIRGEVIGIVTEQSTAEEAFQNRTLRPILKLQNDIFIIVLQNYIAKHKSDFFSFSPEKKIKFIENALAKDIKLRNLFKGLVLGLFTTIEYQDYVKNSSNYNKRILSMLTERLKSQVQLFENNY
jgi:hypothetical protein